VPGLNVKGDYWDHYAKDPLKWVRSELDICQNWHHLFMPMVGGDPTACHDKYGVWGGGAGAHAVAAGKNPVTDASGHVHSADGSCCHGH
jgi:hypothetical protein